MHDLSSTNVQNPNTHLDKSTPLELVIGDTVKPVDDIDIVFKLILNWIESMQDELHQFERLDVWELVPRPDGKNIIVKWPWKNKSDAENIAIQNKSRLVTKGYKQEEGIDFEESFALVSRMKPTEYIGLLQHFKTSQSFRWKLRMHFLMVPLKEEVND
ncbi:retrovirus-related pol polyprotein from transposon TNT 1-94 [Tanacetum coccineum]